MILPVYLYRLWDFSGMKVSVVIGIFNGLEHIEETISSVLAQEYDDFEVIIVNDGSAPDVKTLLDSMNDPRIRVLHKSHNRGLTKALIEGCAIAKGDYIARIDNGDLMVPADRLRIQSEFLDRNSNVVLVGGKLKILDLLNKDVYQSKAPSKDAHDHFSHVTVMFRKDAYEKCGGYRHQCYTGQDSDLWPRLKLHGDCINLNYVFAIAPMHTQSISVQMNNAQIFNNIKRRLELLTYGNIKLSNGCQIIFNLFKLLIPIKVRVKLRYRLNMQYIGKLRENESLYYYEN